MQELIQDEIVVNNRKIRIMKVGNSDYISLTDLARYADPDEPRFPILSWMRNKDVISYLGLWEIINNYSFNRAEFDTVKNEAGSNKFRISPKKWIETTNAIGMITKTGKYNSGTFAHSDIAFEFASWLSPEFKLYLITEFQRLKKDESDALKLEWDATRTLTKLNYLEHTNSIKEIIVPTLTETQKNYIYQEEADILNVALFGQTAKEWRKNNPKLAETGNIRDYASLMELVVLNNLENTNSELIKLGFSQSKRLEILNNSARKQMYTLLDNKQLKLLESKINK